MKLICMGKIKEGYIKEGIADYLKRIKKSHNLEVLELVEDKIDSPLALKKEQDKILNAIKEDDYVILLDRLGQSIETVKFSNKIDNLLTMSKNIVFILGSSYGVGDKVKERSNETLSFSNLTFPHQLFRLLFMEQLYRALKIIKNEPYHK